MIDYQPIQVGSIASMDRRDLVMNIVAVAQTAKLYGVPIVLSTVNVQTGMNQPTIHQLAKVGIGRAKKPRGRSLRAFQSQCPAECANFPSRASSRLTDARPREPAE